jgi:hypothetical protein
MAVFSPIEIASTRIPLLAARECDNFVNGSFAILCLGVSASTMTLPALEKTQLESA